MYDLLDFRVIYLKMAALSVAFFLTTPSLGKPGTFGLGVILGGPTGVSANYQLSQKSSIDGALAWNIGDVVHVHSDYLLRSDPLLSEKSATLVAHYGIGARFRITSDESHGNGKPKSQGRTDLGIRIPLGLTVNFLKPSLEIFFEIAGVLDLLDSTDFGVDGALGGRYYF